MATLGKKLPELQKATTPGATDTAVYGVQNSQDRQLVVNEHIAGLDADKKIPDTLLKMSAFFLGIATGADAAALRTSLGIGAAGTRADAFFATAAQGVLAGTAVQPAALTTALADYVTAATMATSLASKIGTGAEAITAIETVSDAETLAAFLEHVLTGAGTTIPTIATFQDWRDQEGDVKTLGISFWAPLLLKQAMTFGAAVVIDYGDGDPEDIDAGKCRSLYPAVAANADTASVTSIKGVSGLMVDRTVEVLWTNSGGGTRTVSLGTGAGITISHAAGVINPGLGATADDWLKAWVWLKSSTEGVVLGYAAK